MNVDSNNEKLIFSLSTLAENICEIICADIDSGAYETVKSGKSPILHDENCDSFFEGVLCHVKNGLIHPDDADKYTRFFNSDNMKKTLKEDGIAVLSFRKKQGDGYVGFTVELRNAGTENENLYYFFVRSRERSVQTEHIGSEKLTLAEDVCTITVAKDTLDVGTCSVRYDKDGERIGGILYDHSFRKILGYNDDDPMPELIELTYPHDKEVVQRDIVDIVKNATKKETVDSEIRLCSKDGEYHWCHFAGEVFCENGKRRIFVGILVDISKKKEYAKMLDSMANFNKKLETQLEAEQEKNMLIESLGKIYYRIYHIDIKQNKIRTINLRDGVDGEIDESADAQAMLNKVCDEMVVPDHVLDVKLFSDLSTLPMRMGNDKIISNEYLTRQLGWCRSQFIVSSTDESGNIESVLFVCRQIGKEKEERDKTADIIRALSSEYQNAYFVDLNTAEVRSYRMSELITNQFGNTFCTGNYDKNIKTYIDGAVMDEDKPSFEFMTTIEGLRKTFETKERFRFNYRVKRNGHISYFLCQGIRTSDELSDAILGFKNVDESVRQDIVQREKIREALEKAENALESERKERGMLISIANVYHTMHLFNLKDRTLETIRSISEIRDFDYSGADKRKDIQVLIHNTIRNVAKEEHLQMMLDFTDFDTLSERLKGKGVISQEFIGKINGWVRASFIAVKKDRDDIVECLFVTQLINDEKRREEHLIRISKTDQLTGLGNRRAYEEDITKLESGKMDKDIAIVSLDLNSLKQTNDTYGHSAGDELIRGAAECLSEAFGNIGKVYRTGGDEFVAVVNCDITKLRTCVGVLDKITSDWKGESVANLTISKGYAAGVEFPDFSVSELEKKADQRMYQDKEAYYRNVAPDRRAR